MSKFLQLALWNANGLTQYTDELKTFFSIHNIYMLILETHLTEKNYIKLPRYKVYHINYPTGTNSVALICERTIPTERPPLVGKVSVNFCGWRGVAWSVQRIPYGRNLNFLDRLEVELT
jgi:hypothetical protein